ncbi:MAG: DUF1003 domain-containing protein [bacterium]|nr:DUF1003 domain-containing protein [bacterium]
MKKSTNLERICFICQKVCPRQHITSGELVNEEITNEIRKIAPEWTSDYFICHADLALMRSRYVRTLLQSEKGQLSSLEQKVLHSISDRELLSIDLDTKSNEKWSLGERLTDKIAGFGGSWSFLILFSLFLLLWIVSNSFLYWFKPIDPYPFIFLNLILSCVAAIQAPLIMMSQNRQEAKDRVRSQHDYQINLKAELEIQNLHEKMDYLLSHQWEKMLQIQQIQLEMLAEINKVT